MFGIVQLCIHTGKLSAQFEHTLLVTETGVEVLTSRTANSVPFWWESDPESVARIEGTVSASATSTSTKSSIDDIVAFMAVDTPVVVKKPSKKKK